MPIREKRKSSSPSKERYLFAGRLDFSQHLLKYATQDRPRLDFLSDLMKLVLEHSECDAVELWLREGKDVIRCEATRQRGNVRDFRILPETGSEDRGDAPVCLPDLDFERICRSALGEDLNPVLSSSTKYGSFWTGDTHQCPDWIPENAAQEARDPGYTGMSYRSLALVPLRFDREQIGVLQFKNKRRNLYDLERVEYFETLAAKFELALLHQHSQAKLHERVKELTCLYGIARIASEPETEFEDKLMNIVTLLPPAWQYPARACARIIIDGDTFQTPDFHEATHRQKARICVRDKGRGMVEVHYADARPFLQGDPFLEEEQSLINNIAGQIALMIEHKETEDVKSELQNQLIRADRLAAIGQLAAGVAHELNEPLNTILGFAQLVQKTQGMPEQALHDMEKITEASLHARRIIRELLIFARQAAPSRNPVALNRIIEDELNLFESLCRKAGVALQRVLDPDLPEIIADKSQILQVLSNLVVNALQAMPDGGVLTIRTSSEPARVCLAVEDTGIGIPEEIRDSIFVPFFTTKDVDQGTGLGLAVVHGIVISHGGEINVESVPGKGSRFLITLPLRQDANLEED
ncbi:MAG TPA: ATP-binding protein [Deltaproteobacteria bacterium]|nr:ATP-binding protein [Deltaproteobacteria bacterium]HPJ93299.1 ATP-binding protein [Deltaproteobacteria bacterium]HPR52053.1 ATP-binding protein [Deltaproteobacteria bacterium]